MKKFISAFVLISLITTQTHAAYAVAISTPLENNVSPVEQLGSYSSKDYARAYSQYQKHLNMDENQVKADYEVKFQQTLAWLESKVRYVNADDAKTYEKLKRRITRENEMIQDASKSQIQRLEEDTLREIDKIIKSEGQTETRGTIIWGFKLIIGSLLCMTFILAPLGIALMETVPDWFASSF